MLGSLSSRVTKLGNNLCGWSLPAGKEYSCPGETRTCAVRCYAKSGHFHQTHVKAAHRRNLALSRTPDFVDWMRWELRQKQVGVLRIHVAGDFYDEEYVAKWQQIIRASQRTLFFAYTRSWRHEDLLPALIGLSRLPNMSLWWSQDMRTGTPPTVRGVRTAYMAISDLDAAAAPPDADLVFRTDHRTVLKKANGILVCPPENGVTTKIPITCSRCGICWRPGNATVTRLLEHLPTVTDLEVPPEKARKTRVKSRRKKVVNS